MEIQLDRLILENFKCHKHLELRFGGESAAIFGDNATGKTSVYDAFTWLLFGKDSAGNGEKTADVKPLAGSGQVQDHQAVTAVEATLLADGKPVTLRRACRENWALRRGEDSPSYEGNVFSYFVDGVACRKYLFDEKIRKLMPEELFRMLTSVGYFAGAMKWQERRAVLFQMTGSLSDRELLLEEERFTPLLPGLEKLTFSEYKAKLLREKRGLSEDGQHISVRLDECRKFLSVVPEEDFAAAKVREALLLSRQSALEAQLRPVEQAADLRRQQEEKAKRDLQEEKSRLSREEALLAAEGRGIARCEQALSQSRSRYEEIKASVFFGGTCPSCGQALPFARLQEMNRRFREDRDASLRSLADTIRDLEEELALHRENEQNLARSVSGIRQRILAEEAALSQGQEEGDARKKPGELAAVREQLSILRETLAKEEVRAKTQARIAQLEQEEKKAAQALARVEKQLYLMEEFTRYKANRLESDVNSLFRLARFRLFREQVNGGLEDRCDVQYGGVPYGSLNSAMKVNVGIDIIAALSRFYGVQVPLFIDNAESVTQLEAFPGQVIRLVVSGGDPVLRVVV